MLSTEIKEATKQAHQDLEKKVILKLKAIRTDADYADLLKYFYAYFNQIERVITPYITEEILPDYNDRRNSSYLKNDIEALRGSLDNLPDAKAPDIQNHLQAFGALYVMEGSVMGGSIIVQMLEKGGITEGVSFFSGYGAATRQMWEVFSFAMNRQALSTEDKKTIIQSANDTFSGFCRMFG